MKNKNTLVVGFLIVIVVLIAVYLVLNPNKQSKTITQNPTNAKQQNTQQVKAVKEQIVNLTGSGFNPQTLTIKTGTVVVWINKSAAAGSVNSDSYPTNLLFPLLNLGRFDNGASVATTFTKAGKYTYHNQLNPGQTGTIIVN